MVVSVFGGTIAFAGSATAATGESITVGNTAPEESGVTYTTSATVELSSSQDMQYVDVTFADADVSAVTESDITISSPGGDGGQSTFSRSGTDDLTLNSKGGGALDFTISSSVNVGDSDEVIIEVQDVTNPSNGGDHSY